MTERLSPASGVDLHLHTTVHDGRWTPAGLVRHCARQGIHCLAISDHDMVDGIAPAQADARELGLIVLPAVEVTTQWRDQEYHVLVYGSRVTDVGTPLAALLADIHGRQLRCAEHWVQAAARRGMALPSLDAVRRGRELMPVYVLGALIRDGHVAGFAESLDLSRSLGVPDVPGAPLAEAVAAAHATGCVAIIAHPGRNENGFATTSHDELDAMRADAPLDGVEVCHPNHPPKLQASYLEYAQRHRLLVSAGSDSHGPAHARVPTSHPAQHCWPLLERCLPPSRLGVTADISRRLRAAASA